MKISCQSCPAKYTIADEKVVGKIVKIRCKKCGSTIVVNGNEFSPGGAEAGGAEAGEQWTVNVSDGDQRTLTYEEIQTEFANGVVNEETYCWKEGMADWLPLREITELAGILGGGLMGSAPPPMHSASPEAGFSEPAGFPEPSFPSHSNGHHDEPLAAAPAAARRAGGRGASGDLFGGALAAGGDNDVMTSAGLSSPPGESKLTGQRNENSVLFSLNALTEKGGNGATPSPAGRTTAEGDGSGLIDIRALSQSMGAKPKDSAGKVDDIMNLSGGGAFGAALAAPLLTAPIAASAPTAGYGGEGEKGSNKTVLIAGIIGGALLLGVLGVGAMFAFKPDAPVAKNDTPPPATARAGEPAPSVPSEPTPAVGAGAAPESSAVAPNGATSAKAPTVTKAGTTPIAAVGAAPAPTAEKTAEKPPEKAPTKSLAEAMAGAGGATEAPKPAAPAGDLPPFDKGAAQAALGNAAAQAQSCKKPDGPTGSGHIKVTFAPNGSVSSAVADTPPYQGTPVGGCVAAKFRSVHIPAFSGSPVGGGKSFTIN